MSDTLEAPAAEPSGELALTSPQLLTPAAVFAPGGVKDILAQLREKALATPTDISSQKGREAIKSLVYKIARSKTTLDKMGKELTDEWRGRVEAVNLERRQIREELDALGEQIRAPLTEWENAEKARIAAHEAALASICARPGYGAMETAAEVTARLAYLQALPPRDWQEFTKRAGEVLAAEIERTERLLTAVQAREAEQAEVARLRAEAEETARQAAARAQAEREERIAAEAAEAARIAAEERAAREAAETAARVEAERKAAAEAQQAAERRAERLQAEAEAAAARAEEERIRAAEREERARREAVAAEQRRAAEQAAAETREAERRAANLAHKTKINREVLAALSDCGLSEDLGKAVITSIARGEVPHVTLRY